MSAGTTVRFTREDVFGDPARVVVPGDALRPGVNVVRLDKVGDGNLYWSARLSYVVPAQETEAPLTRGIGITRRYRVFAENPITAGQQPVGNLIEVTVDLAAAGSYRYAMLEEPIPAGCEVVQGDEEYGDDEYWGGVPYDRREVWDDRIVYYFDYLRKGETTVSYWLRSEAAGTYRVRPSSASLMYFPEVRGEARPAKLMVVE